MKTIVPIMFLTLLSCAGTKSTNSENYFNGNSLGCGNASVFILNSDGREYLNLKLDDQNLTGKNELSIPSRSVSLEWLVYEDDISATLCNDLMPNTQPKIVKRTNATRALVNVRISEEELEKKAKGQAYNISIEIKQLEFADKKFSSITLPKITVGWLPG